MIKILEKLQGGDLRSIGKVDEVVSDVLSDSSLFSRLIDGMCSQDPVIRMRAADAAEKITRIYPDWLIPFKKRLIEEVPQIEQQEVQWHLAQMFSRLCLEDDELDRVVNLLCQWIQGSKSKIVKVNAMQSLCDIASKHTDLIPLVVMIFKDAITNGSPAVVSRGKKLLRELGMKEPKQ